MVELALCLPILLIITFGSIEAANSIYLKQTLTEVAYETARIAATQGHTEQDARTRAAEILAARGISDAVVEITPAIDANTVAGTPITIHITAPSSSNSIGPQMYFQDATMSTNVVMVRL